MAILEKSEVTRIQLDLSGPDGNAFALMEYATNFCKELGMDPEPILEDMQSDNYEHLIQVFDKHFGTFCDLIR